MSPSGIFTIPFWAFSSLDPLPVLLFYGLHFQLCLCSGNVHAAHGPHASSCSPASGLTSSASFLTTALPSHPPTWECFAFSSTFPRLPEQKFCLTFTVLWLALSSLRRESPRYQSYRCDHQYGSYLVTAYQILTTQLSWKKWHSCVMSPIKVGQRSMTEIWQKNNKIL